MAEMRFTACGGSMNSIVKLSYADTDYKIILSVKDASQPISKASNARAQRAAKALSLPTLSPAFTSCTLARSMATLRSQRQIVSRRTRASKARIRTLLSAMAIKQDSSVILWRPFPKVR